MRVHPAEITPGDGGPAVSGSPAERAADALRELYEAGRWLADAQARHLAAERACRAALDAWARATDEWPDGLYCLPDGEHLQLCRDGLRLSAREPAVTLLGPDGEG